MLSPVLKICKDADFHELVCKRSAPLASQGTWNSCTEWTVRITRVDDDAPSERANDAPKTNADSVVYRVYKHHLDRDIENLGALRAHKTGGQPNSHPVNCHGASNHAYRGAISNDIPPWGPTDNVTVVYEVLGDGTVFDAVGTTAFSRGGVVAFNTSSHSATCTGNSDEIWEFNGKAHNPNEWGLSSISAFTALWVDNHGNIVDPSHPEAHRFVNLVEYYPPPAGY